MPLIDFALLARLVSELDALDDRMDQGLRRADLNYTLCVSTGIQEPEVALARARCLLASQREASAAQHEVEVA
ncbi:DUF5133 domain-containing protein [Streptacidiphilus cavernicola]|uniref:DUF5133 domain-containing protein n=1 Tax=Streptacidiphilus cavernicola TaxID=3342716 RepID=A0ABV6VQH5_9ACTN